MAAPGVVLATEQESPRWVFEPLPKAFQKNPRLDLTVVTELTPEGRKLPEVDDRHPAYYVAQSAGYRRAAAAPAGEKALPDDALEAFVQRSLARRGYYPASDSAAPPSLALVYYWGWHGRPMQTETLAGNELARSFLDRAALVGGEEFREELARLLEESSLQAGTAASPTRHMSVDGAAVGPVLGPEQLEFLNPIERFRDRSPKNEFLLEQVGGDVYYVVVSAYDHAQLLRNRRVLLWRTRMTVSTEGVAQADALPTLITAASSYFGREMDGPAVLSRRAVPRGEVEVGLPQVVEEDVPGRGEPRPER